MEGIQEFFRSYQFLLMFLSGELFLLISRSNEITICIKNSRQRTIPEKERIEKGLLRSFLLEVILFVPISELLFIITLTPILIDLLSNIYNNTFVWYSFMGVSAYGFPYSSIRKFITNVANNALKEWAKTNEIVKQGEI